MAKHEHTHGGSTTRDDGTDVGADMLQGDPDEPQGPEDAFGPGPKRGDYTDRAGTGRHVQMERGPDGKVIAVDQTAHTTDRGEVPGAKGGVNTEGQSG